MAGLLYLVFALLLVGINLWSPERLALSSVPSGLSELDLTGRQQEFEEAWRNSLHQMGLDPDSLVQAVSSRLEEKEEQGAKLKWVSAVTNLTLPPAPDDAQLIAVGNRWKESCAALGLNVSGTFWGRTGRTFWLRLESSAQVNWGGRPIRIPLQKITMIQPVSGRAVTKRRLELQGLIPRETPLLTKKAAPPIPPQPTAVAAAPVPNAGLRPKESWPAPRPTPLPSPAATAAPPPPVMKTRAKVAIIIDDVGYLREPAEELLKVPAPLTWSVLPFTPYSDILIEAGRARGFEIMLHLPLEPFDQKINPGPGVIRIGWPEEQVRKQLDDDLRTIAGVAGINNHMGSAGTADGTLMAMLMRYIKEKGLFFIDSETSNQSVAERYARQYGVPTARRNVFIDNHSSVESKKAQLRELMKIALKNGSAVGIGHTREGTGTAVLEMLPEFVKAGIQIVPASELVR